MAEMTGSLALAIIDGAGCTRNELEYLARHWLATRPIPSRVYYSPDSENFFSMDTLKGMGTPFWNEWKDRARDFEWRYR